MNHIDTKEELRKFVEYNRLTKLELLEVVRKAKLKMNEIREIHNHYKTHYKEGSRELCELRCVTAICMVAQAERIRYHYCATDNSEEGKIEIWEDFKKRWEKIGDTAEEMAESYKRHLGEYPKIEGFLFFALDEETKTQRLVAKHEGRKNSQNAIGFTADIKSVEFDDNTARAKLGFY